MCEDLQQIRGARPVPGAGRVVFEGQQLRGEVKNAADYYEYDRQRFLRYLEDFKLGWGYYLSNLESDIIESKLIKLLGSATFKHTRQPGFLSLIPDRLQDVNLRISEKMHLLAEGGLADGNKEKLFAHLKSAQVDPEKEERSVNMVQSIIHTLHQENSRVNSFQRRVADHNAGQGFKLEDLDKE